MTIKNDVWPVKAGGVYRSMRGMLSAAVIAVFEDDNHGGATVHYNMVGAGGFNAGGDRTSLATFCEMWQPEDQSPIEDLLAALKALVEYESPVNVSGEQSRARWHFAEQAIAKAEGR